MTSTWRSFGIALLALGTTLSDASASAELNSIVSSQNYSMQYSRWPAGAADLSNSKIKLTFYPGYVWDVKVNDVARSQYLSEASIWIGGILGDDTLVSSGRFSEVADHSVYYGYNELLPKDFPKIQRSIYPARTPGFTTYQVELNDERRENLGYTQLDYFRRFHQPLHVVVSQRVHIKNEFPFKGISLLDFTIRNNGNDVIREAWVGLDVDGDAGIDGAYGNWDDDLIGSIRDIHTAYVMDNDGDPSGTEHNPTINVPHAIGIRPVYSSQPATDTNFNWWLNAQLTGSLDFAPRLRGTPDDPFRDYRTDTYGHPSGDVNRYYIMRHKEWDYDQVMSQIVGRDDSVWNPAPDWVDLRATSIGADTYGLLSIGPFELMPDSSMRVIFAVFVGDLIHLDWRAGRDLAHSEFDRYYGNLNFEMLRRSARDAQGLVAELLDPKIPPLAFQVQRNDADSAWFSWESACFPDVTGYALYIRPASPSELLNSSTVLPIAENNDWQDATRVVIPPERHEILVDDLIPGRPYIAALAHITNEGEGNKTEPIVVGTTNQALIPAPPMFDDEFVHYTKDAARIKIDWEPSPDSNIAYYKIYKTDDSACAANKYRPFWSDDSSLVPYSPAHKASTIDGDYWYYEMKPYDSVSSTITSYTDAAPDSTSFYWISAVTQPGFESDFSATLQAEQVPTPSRDVLLVYGTPLSDDDYVVDRTVRNHLEDILGNYIFDIYEWSDTNYFNYDCPNDYCVDWTDLARYDLIIIQEYPQTKILQQAADPTHRLMTRLLESGRTVAYFGIPPGKRKVTLSTLDTLIAYDSMNFAATTMGLDSLILQSWAAVYNTFGAVDTLAGFAGAIPAASGWPDLLLGTVTDKVRGLFMRVFTVDSVLPFVPAFYPQTGSQVLYTYRSGFPNSSRLNGLPCGIAASGGKDTLYSFSFPLWSLEIESGQVLIDRLMQHIQDNRFQPSSSPPSLPQQFTLHTNYPNPFNGTTTITFDLMQSRQASLEIFNVTGARVRTLLGEQPLSPGVHTVSWDGTTDDGRPVASGIYFYRLHTDAGDAVRRMTLIK